MAEQPFELIFSDANNKDIEKVQVKTNSYGTFQGSFIIPMGKLNGRMQLKTKFGSISVRGKAIAFSGFYISGAKVKYLVYKTIAPNYRSIYGKTMPEQIAQGFTETNARDEFSVKFFAADQNAGLVNYSYKLSAEITDINGETQIAHKMINAGKKDLILNVVLPKQLFLNLKNDSLNFNIDNLNGEPIKARLQSEWSLLKAPDRIIIRNPFLSKPEKYSFNKADFLKAFPNEEYENDGEPQNWPIAKMALRQDILAETGKGQLIINSKSLSAGYYKVKFLAINSNDDTVSIDKLVRVYTNKATKILLTSEWLVAEKTDISPGEHAVFRLASIMPNANLYYEIYQQGQIVDKVWLRLSTKQKVVKIKPKADLNQDFAVQFTLVQNGVVFNSLQKVMVYNPAKELDIKFLTFRNKLQPGEKETWKLKISNKAGEKQMAELVATLYDASLDGLKTMNWNNQVLRPYNYDRYTWKFNNNNISWASEMWFLNRRSMYFSGVFHQYENLIHKSYQNFLALNSESNLNEVVVTGYGTTRSIRIRGTNSVIRVEDIKVYDFKAIDTYDLKTGTYIINGKPVPKPSSIVPRSNFSETAFFFPQLQTNEAGEISMEFTIPQSLTRYKMMGFAHTKDLKTATVTRELVTQKQLSISVNAPRFFRVGDSLFLSAKIQNLSGTNLDGNAMLELKDALTGNVIFISKPDANSSQKFNLLNQGNTVVQWPLVIPTSISAITYKVTAESGDYSDGEEMTIPVLPNAILVTESMPLNVRAKQSKTFVMDKLLQSGKATTLSNQSLTVEITSNPAWYAIQALPYLMEYPKEGVEQIFSRFYANSFATHIVNSSPKIKAVFQQCKQNYTGQSLSANLKKNPELKSILLAETPWVRAAVNETEQKKRLGLLFDLDRMSDALKSNFNELESMQLPNGSFSWFSGMQEDRYMTQHIVTGMGQLKHLNLVNATQVPDFDLVLQKAINYLDQQLVRDYKNLAAKSKVAYLPLHYLYGRSYTKAKNDDPGFKRAMTAYLQKITHEWKMMDPFQQGQSALILFRNGNKSEALKIIGLLKERAKHQEDLGMYWPENRAGWWWYQNPVETQALLIEAFDEVAGDVKAVEEMKIWLLQNKQTNNWKNTKATAAACYALLRKGNGMLAETESPVILIGNKTLKQLGIANSTREAGTGYEKFSIAGTSVKPEMGKIEIQNPNASLAWAGLHWQYFEQLDKLTPAATGVKIEKQLFVQDISAKGKIFKPVSRTNFLKTGDLVKVRLVISADRDMEYVYLKDMRAAGFEPVNVISQYKYQDGLSYYESTKDAATNFFIGYLRKGVYVFEYELRVNIAGNFSNGITTLQCLYAPEFSTHSEGKRVRVK